MGSLRMDLWDFLEHSALPKCGDSVILAMDT